MSIINPQNREINCKIVYYGPALAGKTTSLKVLQDKLKKTKKGVVKKVPQTERTLFFDFLALSSKEKIRNYSTKFQVYTVPGQVLYEDSRKLLLNGVDGIVFVADSSIEHIEDSIRSMNELKLNLSKLGYQPDEIPMVIQYNKRDSKTAANLEELRKILNPDGLPDFETVAKTGEGVLDAFETVLSSVIFDLKKAA
ncbi:MAG: gliding-motility protein MglA [Deltaproteobacteria bacterium]|nr:gliding-motility protein MglA [Deltaproteobacteria bacterium]